MKRLETGHEGWNALSLKMAAHLEPYLIEFRKKTGEDFEGEEKIIRLAQEALGHIAELKEREAHLNTSFSNKELTSQLADRVLYPYFKPAYERVTEELRRLRESDEEVNDFLLDPLNAHFQKRYERADREIHSLKIDPLRREKRLLLEPYIEDSLRAYFKKEEAASASSCRLS